MQGCGSQKSQRGRCRLRKNRRGGGDSLVRRQRRGRGRRAKCRRAPAGHNDVVGKREYNGGDPLYLCDLGVWEGAPVKGGPCPRRGQGSALSCSERGSVGSNDTPTFKILSVVYASRLH